MAIQDLGQKTDDGCLNEDDDMTVQNGTDNILKIL